MDIWPSATPMESMTIRWERKDLGKVRKKTDRDRVLVSFWVDVYSYFVVYTYIDIQILDFVCIHWKFISV